jgi:hypothetical protein
LQAGRRSGGASWWWLILVLPFIGTLFPGMYNSMTPALGGLPFFYWYQLLWVVISSALIALVWAVSR